MRSNGPELVFQRLASVLRLSAFLPWLGPVVFALLIALPVTYYFLGFLLHPVEPISRSFSSTEEVQRLILLLGRTAWIAALGATLASAFGILSFAAFFHLRARRILWALCAIPFFMPGHFLAIAWIQAVGNAGWITRGPGGTIPGAAVLPDLLYSAAGCACIIAFHLYPVVLAMLLIGWRGAGASALEAGSVMMSPRRLWTGFIFGWLRPWIAIGWLVVFILGLLDYSIPFLLRQHVFTVEIMSAFNVYYDPPRAMALALPLVAISLLATGFLGRFLSRASWPAFSGSVSRLPMLDARPRIVLLGAATGLLLLAILFPLTSLAGMMEDFKGLRTIFISARPQIATSLLCSGAAALTVFALGLVLAAPPGVPRGEPYSYQSGASGWLHRVISLGMLILFALPGSVVAMAHITFWNHPWPGGLTQRFYDSGLMLPLGLVTLFIPIVYLVMRARVRELPRALMDLERLSAGGGGAGQLRRWMLLVAAHLWRPGSVAAALVFVLAMQEVHGSILLAAPGQATLSIRALTLLHYAPDSLVASFCILSLAAMVLGLAVLSGLGRLVEKVFRRLAN